MGVGGGRIKKAKRWALYARDAFACVYCGDNLPEILVTGGFLTLEHVKTRSRGGNNDPSNLMTCCYSCNVDRGDRTIKAWWDGEPNRPCQYRSLLGRFTKARARWNRDHRVYRSRGHILIGNGPVYGSDILKMDKHPLVAENDARAKRQWERDPPAWLEAEEGWLADQAELICECCGRAKDYQGGSSDRDEPVPWSDDPEVPF
jgi:hypothetical protein